MPIAQIALDVPVRRFFDYRVSEATPLSVDDIGLRVRVPFGTGARIGVVVGLSDTSEHPEGQLKSIDAVLRDTPPLPEDWFRLCQFCSDYYHAPLGEVMMSTLPAALRRVKAPKPRAIRASRKVRLTSTSLSQPMASCSTTP